ncbi:alpha/beta fold hydrolase [Isoptericola cucumis]|uniref:Alpha/beta hydrolase n=1 Tax=Isoptericola cucumis TaxID=1776856 RepID=A0ABQ2BCU3_9MICO|nr:alpha/beta hydrolase [Isoptericola cucumis]GGI11331.1 alpha/beta hydrolase [Isoptericola cucumis]
MPYVPTAVSTGFRVLSAVAPPLAVRLATRVFWRFGPPTPVRPADRAVHDRAERGTVAVGDERVATYRWGDPAAPTALLAHGWKSRASRFAGLVTALEDAGFAVVSFDGIAHGDSTGHRMSALDQMAAIRAVHDAEGPFTAVVGHSLGGLAAGLALHDGFPADRFVSVSTMTGFDAIAESFLRLVGMPPRLHERFCDHVERTFPGGVRDVRARIDLVAHPVPAHVPTLFVHDDDDRMSRPDGARLLHAAVPGSELMVTRGLGHNRILDDPDVLAAVVAHVTAPLPLTVRR